MSKFNVLSAAVVIAVAAIAAPAQAYTLSSTAPNIAYLDIANAATEVTTSPLNVKLTGSDLIIGRTVGFSVKITLKDGATFADDFETADLDSVGAAVTTWTPTVAAGGLEGDDFVIVLFSPAAAPSAVTTGNLFTAGLEFVLDNVNALGTVGATVSAEVMFADPGTAAPIMSPAQTAVILKSANPLDYSIDLSAAETVKKIDVGTGNGLSKTTYSISGAINTVIGNTNQFFNAGALDLDVVTGVVDKDGAPFVWVAADEVDLTLTGAFSAFTAANGGKVVLTATCNAAPTAIANGTGTVTATSVTFEDVSAIDADGAVLCFVAPDAIDEVVIDATSIASSAKVFRGAKSASGTADAKAMAYNGPVIEVDSFNPGSNASVVSYLRITNPSTTAGKATIERICDDGVTKGSATVNVAAGATVALTAKQLEDGGDLVAVGYGACGANQKARLTVTGEFIGMKVQNFLRNTSTIINTNVNNQN